MIEGPDFAVYAGEGTSHSWTWLAGLFERHGISRARFLDVSGLRDFQADSTGSVVISGGDGRSVADAMADACFSVLADFIREGGQYIGICAGAYLPLPSSIEPFRKFNISSTRIENIGAYMEDSKGSFRKQTPYGSCSIIHPVRGDLVINHGGDAFVAPLYGGPVFREPESDEVILRYSGFTEDTELQLDPACARDMVLGKPAAVLCRHGSGRLLLLGPHLEHPRHPDANRLFLRLIGIRPGPPKGSPRPIHDSDLSRSVADLKVAIVGLENRSFAVGTKLWDGGRFLELLSAVERYGGSVTEDIARSISKDMRILAEELRQSVDDCLLDPDAGPKLLVESARLCADSHFRKLAKSR